MITPKLLTVSHLPNKPETGSKILNSSCVPKHSGYDVVQYLRCVNTKRDILVIPIKENRQNVPIIAMIEFFIIQSPRSHVPTLALYW